MWIEPLGIEHTDYPMGESTVENREVEVNYVTATVLCFKRHVSWIVSDNSDHNINTYSGSEPLINYNGDYDSLLSYVLTHIVTTCDIDEFIVRKK